jgi:hypothetical protein
MKVCKIKQIFGYKYIVNHNSKEIHRIKFRTSKCRFSLMKNAVQIRKKDADWLLSEGYDGCKYCWTEKHIK